LGQQDRHLEQAVAAIDAVRRGPVRVHCLTNSVAQNFTANVLLACGAIPSMTVSPGEAPDFTDAADALLLNLGTLDADRRAAMPASLDRALAQGKQVVLDPVLCQLSSIRLDFAKQLLASGRLILKSNRAEADAIGKTETCCQMITGPVDRIEAPGLVCGVENGHPLMDKVVAMGCALGALIAALAARTNDPASAALGGLAWFGVAGEIAGAKAEGPGSFAVAFLDSLAEVQTGTIADRTRIVP
jgi:hydroxyethylthiazole kinase